MRDRTGRPMYSKFKAFLCEKGIQQKEVADLLKINRSTLNVKLNGTRDFSVSEIRTLCEFYRISADEFFVNPSVIANCQR